jgi:Ca2+-binding RTX toxin-like protein
MTRRTTRALALAGLSASVLAGATAEAWGARAALSNSYLTYTAASGEANDVRIEVLPTRRLMTITDPGASITAGPGCVPGGVSVVVCYTLTKPSGRTAVEVFLGDRADSFRSQGAWPQNTQVTLYGGPGDDNLAAASPVVNYLVGDSGDDVLEGTDGTDVMIGGSGADRMTTRGGEDHIYYRFDDAIRSGVVRISLDGLANDGEAGEGDNVDPEAEAVFGAPDLPNVMIGGGTGNFLSGSVEDDVLEGGGGNDMLVAGPGDDRLVGGSGADSLSAGGGDDDIDVRDGERDEVECGAGVDSVLRDLLDVFTPPWPGPDADCESVTL